MQYKPDDSGINSLAGFAYQIKVFAYYAFDLKEDMSVEFETIEDINLRKVLPTQIDDQSHSFVCKTMGFGINNAIQVKHTSMSNAIIQQMIFNWILLEKSSYQVEKYLLFTDSSYNNNSDIFTCDAKELYKIVISSNKKANATITKVKKLFDTDFADFEKVYSDIQGKYEFVDINDIDSKIEERAAIHFRKAANAIVYGQRLEEFLQHITVQILKAIESKNPYILTYAEFINIIEDVTSRFTSEITAPCYSDFKKINQIDLKNSQLSKSREFIQLQACELSETLIKQHLLYGLYYHQTALKYMENNRTKKIEDIEETTHENFDSVKFDLQRKGEDSPYNRLAETKKQPNSFAENDQIKFGSSIHLTKDNIGKSQISWKDDDNA